MFGYLKLDNNCPKNIRAAYKKYYCFLCRALEEHYGIRSRFLLSYDVAFYLILCADEAFLDGFEKIGCIKKNKELRGALQKPIAKQMAALNVLLAAAKLQDDIIDDNDIKAKAGTVVLSSAIKKAKNDFPLVWEIIDNEYKVLRDLELAGGSLSELEVQFSRMMKRLTVECFGLTDEKRLAILEMGTKWIYFIDAVDDIDDNIMEGTFNPLTSFHSFSNLKNENYTFVTSHFNEIRKVPPIISGGVEAEIINRLVHVRLIECTVDVLTKDR